MHGVWHCTFVQQQKKRCAWRILDDHCHLRSVWKLQRSTYAMQRMSWWWCVLKFADFLKFCLLSQNLSYANSFHLAKYSLTFSLCSPRENLLTDTQQKGKKEADSAHFSWQNAIVCPSQLVHGLWWHLGDGDLWLNRLLWFWRHLY